jgi:hypothetical protein
MPKQERPLQQDMFSGELVDNRSRSQKKRDAEREKPKQALLFSQREIAQFGVNPHPQFPLSPHTLLRLISEDPRTPEEKEPLFSVKVKKKWIVSWIELISLTMKFLDFS